MAIWIQSLSWALIFSLGQGFLVYASLTILLKMVPGLAASTKYRLSLAALLLLLGWFGATWSQQYQNLSSAYGQLTQFPMLGATYPNSTILTGDGNVQYGWYGALSAIVFRLSPWLSAGYLVGLALMVARLSSGMLQLFSLNRTGLEVPHSRLQELLVAMKDKMQFSMPVQLFVSVKVPVPMVVGFIKPLILMPAAAVAQLSMAQLETILQHELAHIKRYDHLANILLTTIESILFFNPFVWMTTAIARREMEYSCDDLVLSHTQDPLHYATALATLAAQPAIKPTLAVAATGTSHQLFNRIKRIMEMKKSPISYSRMVAAILITTAITCSVAALTPSTARARKGKEIKVATSATATATAKPQVTASEKKQATAPVETEENTLVNRLIADGLVDQINGFLLEKEQGKLYIDRRQLAEDVAAKYLSGIKKEYIRVQVHSFTDRMRMHPDASFIQLLLPVQFSSGCVESSGNNKPGC